MMINESMSYSSNSKPHSIMEVKQADLEKAKYTSFCGAFESYIGACKQNDKLKNLMALWFRKFIGLMNELTKENCNNEDVKAMKSEIEEALHRFSNEDSTRSDSSMDQDSKVLDQKILLYSYLLAIDNFNLMLIEENIKLLNLAEKFFNLPERRQKEWHDIKKEPFQEFSQDIGLKCLKLQENCTSIFNLEEQTPSDEKKCYNVAFNSFISNYSHLPILFEVQCNSIHEENFSRI